MNPRSLSPLVAALTLALVALAGPASALGAPAGCADADTLPGPAASEASLSSATVCLINRERTSRGLRELRTNRRLSRAAVAHNEDMIKQGYFEHVSPTGKDVVDRLRSTGYLLGRVKTWLVGENLAWGIGTLSTPREIVTSWMNSPGHRRNMLNRRFREIGIGVVFSVPNDHATFAATYTTTFGYKR
jgi:uncharacterized protein YkwD